MIVSVLPWLTACTETGLGFGGWSIQVLSLALAASLAYALGAMRSQQRSASQLRASREAARQAQQLQVLWSWRTDAAHRLLLWRAPGQANSASCTLFDPGAPDSMLMARLKAERPFAALRLHSLVPLEGNQGWELRGEPQLDDTGAFAGFVGSACPCDADDEQAWAARALAPLLRSQPLPTLLALHSPQGWHVRHLNPAARALWPTLADGSPLPEGLDPLPAQLGPVLEQLTGTESLELEGWRITPLATPPAGWRVLLLMQLPQATSALDTPPAHESETFSFTLSHDLRAPIRVVEGFTRIVKEDYGRHLDRVGNDHLDRVLSAAARMNQMIDALLALARLSQQPLARQRIDLSQLAGFVVDDLRRTAPERAAEVTIEPGLTAWGDPTLMRLVLENLLGNAWKYTQRCNQTQISMRALPHGDKTAYVVRDNGAGFDMACAERLFGLFQRLHSASDFPGHGVGLASVRRIVRRHGGEVWAEAEVGRGAAFFFTVPD